LFIPFENERHCGNCAIIPRGPTLSDRISRSQSIRCSSVRCVVLEVLMSMWAPRGSVDQLEGVGKGLHNEAERGTFSATFFLACLAAMELEGVVLEEI
jgi:hypothetical protein